MLMIKNEGKFRVANSNRPALSLDLKSFSLRPSGQNRILRVRCFILIILYVYLKHFAFGPAQNAARNVSERATTDPV